MPIIYVNWTWQSTRKHEPSIAKEGYVKKKQKKTHHCQTGTRKQIVGIWSFYTHAPSPHFINEQIQYPTKAYNIALTDEFSNLIGRKKSCLIS